MATSHDQVSRYLEYLPAIYQADVQAGRPHFLGRFLLAFEEVLTGPGEQDQPGLEEILKGADRYFDPQQTRSEFLEWLAGWVALALRADLDEKTQRDFITQAASLYRIRGTKQSLEQLLRIYTGLKPDINEATDQAHFFRVVLKLEDERKPASREFEEWVKQVATAIIDMEKPAHTWYVLDTDFVKSMQIGIRSTIGKDTVVGRALR